MKKDWKGIVYQVIIKKNYNMIFMYINELKNYISGFKGESTLENYLFRKLRKSLFLVVLGKLLIVI